MVNFDKILCRFMYRVYRNLDVERLCFFNENCVFHKRLMPHIYVGNGGTFLRTKFNVYNLKLLHTELFMLCIGAKV